MSTGPHAEQGSWADWHDEAAPLRLGASSCLLGDEVRFNSGHCRERFMTDVLGRWIEWVRVCPEVDMGMPIPRPAIRLVEEEEGAAPRLVTSPSKRKGVASPEDIVDHTEAMARFSEAKLVELEAIGLDGFVLKKDSPSCGLERVRVYANREDPGGLRHKLGRGLFAAALARAFPDLPLEEDGRLNDARIRENFIERVFSHNRWRSFLARRPDRGALVAFHTAHKLLLWSHNETGMRRLGRILGEAGKRPDAELIEEYGAGFHEVMRSRATPKRHVNVLQHALGYLKRTLTPIEKRELLTSIEDYRQGLLPLIVPMTLMRYNVVRHGVDYLQGQLYFEPHPKELLLRNHV